MEIILYKYKYIINLFVNLVLICIFMSAWNFSLSVVLFQENDEFLFQPTFHKNFGRCIHKHKD